MNDDGDCPKAFMVQWPEQEKADWLNWFHKLSQATVPREETNEDASEENPQAPPPQAIHYDANKLLEQYSRFYDALIAYNEHVNLTRITEPVDFLYRHLLDSLLPLPWIPSGANIADVGSGAGFPALPLAMARADIHVTAIESTGKKCKFLEQIRQDFGLSERFTVLSERVETLARQKTYREKFDIVTARGVASLPTLLEFALPLLRPGGRFLALKGPKHEEELERSMDALDALHAELQAIQTFQVPELKGSVLMIFEKTGKTPKLYPREQGLPLKKPL